ncbi:MAG TPA: glycosyltransferase family 2 protein [Rhodanobacteraceae bacterium]|nr:glycosyltransferase family 2 protein [Rhodanobacteraceae bacterium]
MSAPKISICVMVYNHVNVIESTLRTLLVQSVTNFELIVSDDCSTDGTWALLESIQKTDPRIRVIRTPRNVGMAANANFAVQAASGEYIALLHHDDLYRADLIEQWARVLDEYPDVGFVFNPYGLYGTDDISAISVPSGRLDGTQFLTRHLFPSWGCPIHGTAMIRRSAWERTGGMRLEFGLLADIDLWMRLAAQGPVGYVDEPLITVRHARPDYYPDIYTGKNWSWKRHVLLYLIHGANRESFYRNRKLRRLLVMLAFRFRLSVETAKWISYAIVRKKSDMLRRSNESRTAYDMLWLRIYRAAARLLARSSPA